MCLLSYLLDTEILDISTLAEDWTFLHDKVLCILGLCSLFQALRQEGWCVSERHAKMQAWSVFPAPISSHCLHNLNAWNMLGLWGIDHCVSTCYRLFSGVITTLLSHKLCYFCSFLGIEKRNPSLLVNVKLGYFSLFWYNFLSFSYKNHAKKIQ